LIIKGLKEQGYNTSVTKKSSMDHKVMFAKKFAEELEAESTQEKISENFKTILKA
jgi:hypothetical protein